MQFINTISLWINDILTFFYSITNNYGLAIILLTVLVNIVTFPLTRKQIQSSKRLQQIQPELKKLQEKYKNDKEKYNKATMEFMRENKVNPLGGCLPLLVQFPVLIAIFNLLRQPEEFMTAINDFNFLYLDLTEPDPIYLLPLMAAAATYFHQRLVMTDPKQKMLMYLFPVMIFFISAGIPGLGEGFPAGLVLYWFTNSLFSVGNHYLIKTSDQKQPAKKDVKIKEEKSEIKNENGQKETAGKEKEITSNKKQTPAKKTASSTEAPQKKKKSSKGKKKGAGKKK